MRIVKKKNTFEEDLTPNWTEELFAISKVKHTKPVTYTINGIKGEENQGTFYEPEFLPKAKQEIYRIEKLLTKRIRRNGIKKVYVKWKGYNNDFNSWIPVTYLQQ